MRAMLTAFEVFRFTSEAKKTCFGATCPELGKSVQPGNSQLGKARVLCWVVSLRG
jgi:hypothetical protein